MGHMSLESTDEPASFTFKREYIIGFVIVLVALIPSLYFYRQYRAAQDRLANPTQFAADEAKQLVAQVSRLMELPTSETPTIATVNDKEKLKNQAFFAHAENGDKVLIYSNAKKAILYRPSINKIIDVAPINLGPAATASAQTTPAAQSISFVIRNGTSVIGLTHTYEAELKSKVPNAVIADTDNAKSKTYDKSLLVDVTGTKAAQVTQIAGVLGLTVSPLPAGESTPSSDFLIILGADKK